MRIDTMGLVLLYLLPLLPASGGSTAAATIRQLYGIGAAERMLSRNSKGYDPGSAWLTSPPNHTMRMRGDGDARARGAPEVFTVTSRTSPTRCDIIRRSSLYSPECNAVGARWVSEQPRPLLVSGIGRTGTTYLQKLLTFLGLDIRHDARDDELCSARNRSAGIVCGKHGAVSWVHAFADAGVRFLDPASNTSIGAKIGAKRSFSRGPPGADQLKRGVSPVADRQTPVRYCRIPSWSWSPGGQRFKMVVHLVRDPLKSIISRSNFNARSVTWVGGFVACLTSVIPTRALDQHGRSGGVGWYEIAEELMQSNTTRRRQLRRKRAKRGGEPPPIDLERDLSRKERLRVDVKLLVSLRHYVTWNSFVERVASLRLRVEDLGYDAIQQLCEALPELWASPGTSSTGACPSQEAVAAALESLSTHVNHEHVTVRAGLSKNTVTWARLGDMDWANTALAQAMALRYGYDDEERNATTPSHLLLPKERLKELEAQTEFGFTELGQWYYRLPGADAAAAAGMGKRAGRRIHHESDSTTQGLTPWG